MRCRPPGAGERDNYVLSRPPRPGPHRFLRQLHLSAYPDLRNQRIQLHREDGERAELRFPEHRKVLLIPDTMLHLLHRPSAWREDKGNSIQGQLPAAGHPPFHHRAHPAPFPYPGLCIRTQAAYLRRPAYIWRADNQAAIGIL